MIIDGTAIAIGITVARTVAVVELDPATKLLQHQLICGLHWDAAARRKTVRELRIPIPSEVRQRMVIG
jgi:hypothetical protein